MTEENITNAKYLATTKHFPISWIKKEPRKVEEILSALSLEQQTKYILNLPAHLQRELLVLCENAVEVTQSLPTEEIYNLIKELGNEESILILSMVSEEQLQFIFDLEWWQGDKFQPKRAIEWLELLDKCDDPQVLEWFLNGPLCFNRPSNVSIVKFNPLNLRYLVSRNITIRNVCKL